MDLMPIALYFRCFKPEAMITIFRSVYLAFLIVMALVVGGASYQTISIVPFWQQDLSMFKNYGHWGIDYFPILSPLMGMLWLVLLITGFGVKFPNKTIFYIGHGFFVLLLTVTFAYFAPFLLTYMGNQHNNLTDQELTSRLHIWAKWDLIRQIVGLIPLAIFIYCYGNAKVAEAR